MRGRQTVIEAWKLLYYLPCTTGTWPASSFQSSFAPRSKQVRTGRVSPSDGKITPTSISVTPVSMTARIRTRSRSRSMALARHWGFISQRTTTLALAAYPSDAEPSCPVHHPRRACSSAAPPLEARVASLFSPSPSLLTFCPDPGHPSVADLSSGRKLNGPKYNYSKVKWVSQIFVPGSQNTLASGCDKFAPALAFLFGLVLPSKI